MRFGFHSLIGPRREVGYRVSRASFRSQTRRCSPRPASLKNSTIVAVELDLGSKNWVYIRGKGAGLSWDKGQPLVCVGPRTWAWSVKNSEEPVEFQLLLNDEIWARGETVVLEPGSMME